MADDKREIVVDVTGKRLMEIVKAIIGAGEQIESEIIKKFGHVTFTVALKDAEEIKSLVANFSTTRAAGHAQLRGAMPADFDHCKPRPRG